MTSIIPTISQKITTQSQLVLQLFLKNSTNENLLFRPTIEDWVIDNKEIISSISTINPPYTSLQPQGEISQIITLELPPNLHSGQTLKNWLRFPGIQEEAIPLDLEIIPSSKSEKDSQILTISLPIKLPCSSAIPNNSHHQTTDGIFALMSGIIDLDKIPSRWLVAELCVKLCQIGEKYSESQQGFQLLKQLKSTVFFQNGVTAFSAAKVPEWIAQTISSISATLSCPSGEGHLLYLWESWLFSLVKTDLECHKIADNSLLSDLPKFFAQAFITQMGMSSERWFSGIILGLANLSPQIEITLKKIASQKNFNKQNNQSTIDLISGLPGFDFLPCRWLAIEILLVIAQIGNKYAQTEAGKTLLSRLSRTRFFKNGILAFASAQIARWIDISQSAITAYYSSVGLETGNNGLLYLWQMWLWSLAPNQLDISLINSELKTRKTTREILVKDVGMNEQRWFSSIVLGLGQVSPRIAQQLIEISDQVDDFMPETPVINYNYDDVISEIGSMQR